MRHNTFLFEMFCYCIVENKGIGIYDGAFKNIELATEKEFVKR